MTEDTKARAERLKELAAKAEIESPPPWGWDRDENMSDSDGKAIIVTDSGVYGPLPATGEYIAACDPPTITALCNDNLTLLAENELLGKDVKDYQALLSQMWSRAEAVEAALAKEHELAEAMAVALEHTTSWLVCVPIVSVDDFLQNVETVHAECHAAEQAYRAHHAKPEPLPPTSTPQKEAGE